MQWSYQVIEDLLSVAIEHSLLFLFDTSWPLLLAHLTWFALTRVSVLRNLDVSDGHMCVSML